jgi:hypothetical protein
METKSTYPTTRIGLQCEIISSRSASIYSQVYSENREVKG